MQRDPLAHHPEQHEDVGDHHGGEQLQEVLDPEVDDPEAPEVGDREAVVWRWPAGRPRRRPGSPARRRRTARACCPTCSRRSRPRRPRKRITTQRNRPIDQQDLPEAAEVEVLEALVAERSSRSPNQPWMSANSPIRLPNDDHRQRAEQAVGELCSGRAARGRRSSARGRSRRPGTRWRRRRSRAARARCGPGCRASTWARSMPKKPSSSAR